MIQHSQKRSIVRALFAAALCLMLFSFTGKKFGGESFSIYMGDKLILQQHVSSNFSPTKPLQINQSNSSEVLRVYYNHCGKVGVGRSLTLRDENKTLKTWHYPDAENAYMTCEVKEILSLYKSNGRKTVSLSYTSKELSKGLVLATIAVGGDEKAGLE